MTHNFTKLLNFIPFQRNALFFAVALFGVVYFTRSEYYVEGTTITVYLQLFGWLIGTFIALLVSFGLVYTLVCWLHFLWNRKRITAEIQVGLNDGVRGYAGQVPVALSLSRALLPLIGYIKMRIVFEGGYLSDTIMVNKFSKGFEKLMPKKGSATLWLPDRKQYHIKGFIISFEDFLQFFRFSVYKEAKMSFYLQSTQMEVPMEEIHPSKTEEEIEKIKTSRKVEGDFLNYKAFEVGDDVRRIVWKIFAKNKELVVRIPEVINPYASHINFYTSFYNSTSSDLNSPYATSMLNYFKDVVYNVCSNITKSDKKVEFHIDQEVNQFVTVGKKEQVAFQLSSASWQNDFSVNDLNTASSESIICVSTLVDSEELKSFTERSSSNLIIIEVSRHLDAQNLINFKNLFLRKDQKNELSKLVWFLSSTRRELRRNEKRVQELVSNLNFQGQVI